MTVRSSQKGIGYAGAIAFIMAMALLLTVILEQRAIADWFLLRGYTPDQKVAQLASDTAMSSDATHMFYVNRPRILDKADFRTSCPNYGEQTIVIGCYKGNQRGINLLSVTDERLSGVEQVTAAHEMLHAAYDRLSKSERAQVNGWLQDYADHTLQDDRIKQTLKSYESSEPGEQLNEMHSIFGTEVANLSPQLENYYKRYFNDRAKVTGFAVHYQAAFTSRQTTIKQYDTNLKTLGEAIKAKTADLKTEADAVDADRQKLDAYRRDGNVAAYNAGVAPFNAKVDDYNTALAEARKQIDQYNELVEQRNAIAAQTLELQQAIDSSNLPKSQ